MNKIIKAWAGLVLIDKRFLTKYICSPKYTWDDMFKNKKIWKLDLCDSPDSDILSIFKSKKEASKSFSKVVRCEIKLLK